MKTSETGIKLIKYFEGVHDGDKSKPNLQPKMDPVGIWTVGYGHALKNGEKWLKGEEDKHLIEELYPHLLDITEEQAEELLKEDLVKVENIVTNNISIYLHQHEFDALVSHTYNTGGSAGLFHLIDESEKRTDLNYEKIRNWWTTTYITAAGIKLNGLVKRRLTEWNLFKSGVLSYAKI